MHQFYLKALLRFVLLLAISSLVGYACLERSYHRQPLFGAGAEEFSWRLGLRDKVGDEGTALTSKAGSGRLVMEYNLSGKVEAPFATAAIVFTDREGKPKLLDWSRFGKMSFQARCSPANTLVLSMATFDDKVSQLGNTLSHRSPTVFLDCNETGNRTEIDLKHMSVPLWWLEMFKFSPSDQAYSLAKVAQLEFGTSGRSPTGVPSRVEISGIELHDRQYGYLYFLGAFLVLAWSGFGLWFFRNYGAALARQLRARMHRDLPLVAYQQLSLEPHRDKEKATILNLLATHYADPELDLDTVITRTGINRNKINDILKAEFGYTFTGYLNKLRLTEASRLLAENSTASIAEIAYSVGYKNPSYFNKLFKEEYGCTPRAFKEVCKRELKAA